MYSSPVPTFIFLKKLAESIIPINIFIFFCYFSFSKMHELLSACFIKVLQIWRLFWCPIRSHISPLFEWSWVLWISSMFSPLISEALPSSFFVCFFLPFSSFFSSVFFRESSELCLRHASGNPPLVTWLGRKALWGGIDRKRQGITGNWRQWHII